MFHSLDPVLAITGLWKHVIQTVQFKVALLLLMLKLTFLLKSV